jgi:hypothetical protein
MNEPREVNQSPVESGRCSEPTPTAQQLEEFFSSGVDARVEPGRGIDVGIDMPGVGFVRGRDYVAGEMPSPLREFLDDERIVITLTPGEVCELKEFGEAEEKRVQLFAELIFASRTLATSRISYLPHRCAKGEQVNACCRECWRTSLAEDGRISHVGSCKTGRLLNVLDRLVGVAQSECRAALQGGAR